MNTENFSPKDINFGIVEFNQQINEWANLQATNLLAGFNRVMESSRNLAGNTLDRFLEFAIDHPVIAIATKTLNQLSLPRPSDGFGPENLETWVNIGTCIGTLVIPILEIISNIKNDKPIHIVDVLLNGALGSVLGGLFGYGWYFVSNHK